MEHRWIRMKIIMNGFLSIYTLNFLSVCGALSLSRVIVPPYKLAGDTVVLECPYELNRNQQDRIYAVKWYKDNEEFYRYVPKYTPPVYSFDKLEGVRVHMSSSDSKKVTLKNVDLRSTGIYRCEVSAEAPSFASVHGDGRLTVVHLPEGGKPRIEGKVKAEYEVGDVLNFTCSAGKSFPPVKLSWYINDVPVPSEQVHDLSPHRHSASLTHHLTPSLSQLKVTLTDKHFNEDGNTKILCKGSIQPINTWYDGDERTVASSRKYTDLRSNFNTFNVSPITIFDEDDFLTIRGDAVFNNSPPGFLFIFSFTIFSLFNPYYYYSFIC